MGVAWQALAAALPIALILIIMLGLGWSAARAGAIGLVATLLVAGTVFDFGAAQPGGIASYLGAMLEAGFIALTVLWIIFPALCIYHLQESTGAINSLRDAIASVSPDPRIAALLIGWFFALFMEGAAGFGTSAALAAPFLVGMGIARIEAVCIALIGHAVGVSFGAVGTPISAQVAITPFLDRELSAATAAYHALAGAFMALMLVALVNRALPAGAPTRSATAIFGWTALAAGAFLLPFYLLAVFVGSELPTLGASVLGAALFVGLFRWIARPPHSASVREMSLPRAAAPYLILIVLILLTRLISPLGESLRQVEIRWQLGEFGGGMAPFYHPGSLLMMSFLAAAFWQRASAAAVRSAMAQAASRLLLVSLALFFMLALSRLMVHAGMIEVLALAAVAALGGFWPFFAPFVGALGTFVTGSATASNILFTEFQRSAAERLGFSSLALVGAQGFGAAVGNIVCPHNIIAANAVVKVEGQEGVVLRRTVGIMLIYTSLGGLLALFVFT